MAPAPSDTLAKSLFGWGLDRYPVTRYPGRGGAQWSTGGTGRLPHGLKSRFRAELDLLTKELDA
uniref:Uncharacterized protein n=1 Tax=Magnetococcus massalia (strain MO-1) TaxID=451514 RepID=A0A1S7LNA6_MAGMO|nr:protein of unknown function [Candidatus Magnetococcus massalia]